MTKEGRMATTEAVTVLAEPELEFGLGQSASSPHDGLSLYGPYDAERPHHPASLSYGVVGTPDGVASATRFFDAVRGPLRNDSARDRLWPQFPGFEAAFGSALCSQPTSVARVD